MKKRIDPYKSFIDAVICGEAYGEDIDDYVDIWHEGKEPLTASTLVDFLGLSNYEYQTWVLHPERLPEIIKSYLSMKEFAPIDYKKSKTIFDVYWDCCDGMRYLQDEGVICSAEDIIGSGPQGWINGQTQSGRFSHIIHYCPCCGVKLR